MTNETKETTQYITAIFTLFTGIAMCFLSFFLSENHIVHDSVLWYFGETIAFTGGIFGIGLYVNHQVKKAELRINTKIEDKIQKVDDLLKDIN